MAWILGCANAEELKHLDELGANVRILTPDEEYRLFGQERDEDDTDKMIMIEVDKDAEEIYAEMGGGI